MADPDSSYGNDVTNIEKLSALYSAPPSPEGIGSHKRLSSRLYIAGIGTEAGKEDSAIGAGAGRGASGVSSKVQEAFSRIKDLINDVFRQNRDCHIHSVVFDCFGFSRGAAAARHFANEVVRGDRGLLRAALRDNPEAFCPSFVARYQHSIDVRFIGLFDTVASVGGLANLGNIRSSVTPWLNLYLPRKYFSNVVQLVARDEVRANFPLSTVKPDHTEIVLPGVHSDIGGGYLSEAEECVLVAPMQALVVADGVDVMTTSIYRDAEQAKLRLIDEGWPPSMLEVVTPERQLLPVDPADRLAPRQSRVYAGLQLKRRVRGELSGVYLRVMHMLAKNAGAPFDDIPEEPRYLLPAELEPLASRFAVGDYNTTSAEEQLLKQRYIHVSAHWNHPIKTRSAGGLGLFYINAPSPHTIRRQHPHVPDWTLL
ncbi:T6SS phospholipase effector Tle1-like catalytic domain-containing protein [Stutzerimonas marianensis]|uniref:T6SS phospholipase effector Tle1-like catalytic domain-containing protein n=1 Tax=Stutzerimonas marianensis TaxID=2929513 RepID=UPI003C2FADE3